MIMDVSEILKAIADAGITPPETIINDGSIHRFSSNGDKSDLSGWYVAFPDGGCVFGDWHRAGEKFTVKPAGFDLWTDADRKVYRDKIAHARAEARAAREKEQAKAAARANQIWESAAPADPTHPYLTKKQIKPHGIRISGKSLIIPIMDATGKLQSLQFIDPTGKKKFLPGGRISGCFHVIGGRDFSNGGFMCEGWATGCSIHEATGKPVVVAFNSANLPAVAEKFKDYPLIIAADNDLKTAEKTGKNPGVDAAKKASEKSGLPYIICPVDSDFNDMAVSQGLDAVKRFISENKKIGGAADGWPDPDRAKKAAENILKNQEPCGPFDLSIVPELVREYVESICRSTDADPVLVLMAVISAMSARIGRRLYLPVTEYFTKLFCNVWVLVLSLSGSFKTTAINKGCRIVYQKNSEIMKQIEMIKGDPAYQNDPEELKKRITEIEATGCLLPNRMSAEGLLDLLGKGCGGLLPASEFGEWLANLGKSHNTGLKPLFTDLYDVPMQYSYVTRGGGHLIIRRPYISILGVSTLEWIRANVALGDVGSGFFARFLLFYPPQKKAIPPALPNESEPVDIFAEQIIVDRLNKLPPDLPIRLKPDSRSYFERIHAGIYAAIEQLNDRDQELLAPYIKRWSPYVLKVAMIFQAVQDPKKWIQDVEGGKTGFVSVENIQAAAAVVEYAMKSTVYLFQDQLGMSKFQMACKAVLEFIAKNGGTVIRHKLLSSKVLSDGAKQYDEIIETLMQQNRIEIIPNKHKIKKNERYQLVGEFEKV